MDVSGRKQTDRVGSIAAGSAEDFDQKCEPCLTTGEEKEAHGFCVKCQEYLCKTCRDCHKKTKALRGHEIIGKDKFDKIQPTDKSYSEITEECPHHHTEIIKFYCQTHATLGCNDCMTIGHRTCGIDYIPVKCVGIADGEEYNDIMRKLDEKLREAEKVSKNAESKSKDINDINKEVVKKIAEFRAEIDDRLDQMQHDFLQQVDGKKSINNEIAQKVIDTCSNIISDLKKLQSNLHTNKSNNQNGQLYIDIKRAESALKSDEISEAKENLKDINIQYSFRRNTDFENFLSKKIVFGELINNPRPESTKGKIDQLTMKNDINVKTKSDKNECRISGCAVLPSNKLVLADNSNLKVKVVSVENKRILKEKVLDSKPWGVAVMSENKIVVTMPDARRIYVMTTDDKLSRLRCIKVDGKCYGIDCQQDRLYVVCYHPSCVIVLNTLGNVLHTIPLNFLLPPHVPFITIGNNYDSMYISDHDNNRVVSVSQQGHVSSIYKHNDLQGTEGICLLDDGSLLVCCYEKNSIHRVRDDLKEEKSINRGVSNPLSICYSADNDEVYVGSDGDQMQVLSTN